MPVVMPASERVFNRPKRRFGHRRVVSNGFERSAVRNAAKKTPWPLISAGISISRVTRGSLYYTDRQRGIGADFQALARKLYSASSGSTDRSQTKFRVRHFVAGSFQLFAQKFGRIGFDDDLCSKSVPAP